MRKWTFGLAAIGLSLFVAGTSLAQNTAPNQPGNGQGQNGGNGGGGRRGGFGGGGGRGNFDPAQMRAGIENRIKEQLGATDEEWTAIQPRLDKVMVAREDARGGGRGGFGGLRGGRRGGETGGGANGTPPASTQPVSAVAKASSDLQTAIENKDTPPADLASKLAALRDAREKAKGDLTTAQKSLKELLTQRQEAILVNMGYLD